MPGPIALVGSGEFTPSLEPVDRVVLDALGGRAQAGRRLTVSILPTASAPDGETTFQRWGRMGRDHFRSLGTDVEVLEVRDRVAADDAGVAAVAAASDLVYLSGGKPDFLVETLEGTALGGALRTAWEDGAALAGCSAGAMALAGERLSFGARVVPARWRPALGFVPRVAVAPHYDRWPETMMAPLVLVAPSGTVVLGIDEETALVGIDGRWVVHGVGRVTVWRGSHRSRFTEGERVSLEP
jgi:cyanophycinase